MSNGRTTRNKEEVQCPGYPVDVAVALGEM